MFASIKHNYANFATVAWSIRNDKIAKPKLVLDTHDLYFTGWFSDNY